MRVRKRTKMIVAIEIILIIISMIDNTLSTISSEISQTLDKSGFINNLTSSIFDFLF